MLKFMKIAPAALVLILISISASFAQQTATPPPAKSDDDFVTEKGFKSKVFEVKYRDAGSLAKVLQPLGSGFKGATIWANSEFKTITIRDFPENLATIEEAIRRLDTPAAPRANIELHMYVLVASNTSGTGDTSAPVPTELKDVLTQLRGTLNYRNYELAATVVERITETRNILQGTGAGEVSHANPTGLDMALPYQYGINSVSLVQNPSGAPTVQINDFTFRAQTDHDQIQVQTALNLRDGEKVVVGTATIRNRALIVVLSAKLVN
jgi:type II secretory pathway component GspD/PulD (secretin)